MSQNVLSNDPLSMIVIIIIPVVWFPFTCILAGTYNKQYVTAVWFFTYTYSDDVFDVDNIRQ